VLAGSRFWLVDETIDGDRADQGEGVDFPGHLVARQRQWSALQLKVEVRSARVTRIPDPSDDLARPYFLAHRDADRRILQMPIGGKDVVAQIEHDGVAGQLVQRNPAGKAARRLIRLIGDNADHGTVGHGQDGLIKREVALVD
jgi:hypothetical protein